jgi:hypothetical protein
MSRVDEWCQALSMRHITPVKASCQAYECVMLFQTQTDQ